MLVAGEWVHGDEPLEVHHPYDGSLVQTTTYATKAQVEAAVAAADGVRAEAERLPIHARAEALASVSRQIQERADEIAELITAENGKPLLWAKGEVGRAVSVFRWAAEETRQQSGEVLRLDTDAAAEGRMAYVRRVPKGPVLAISPFNFPLNLVAHKVAPAIAVGAPVVLKPAPKTPLSALLLGELLDNTDLPPGMVNVINVRNDQAKDLVADPRLPVVSFTGSGPVGYAIQEQVPGKHVVLELGGNAAVVVAADWSSDEDLDWAATRIANFGNYQAGQSCIGVQRVYADGSLYDALRDRIVTKVEALRTGDPKDPEYHEGLPICLFLIWALAQPAGYRVGRTVVCRRQSGEDERARFFPDVAGACVARLHQHRGMGRGDGLVAVYSRPQPGDSGTSLAGLPSEREVRSEK